jgi:hypothetical protein
MEKSFLLTGVQMPPESFSGVVIDRDGRPGFRAIPKDPSFISGEDIYALLAKIQLDPLDHPCRFQSQNLTIEIGVLLVPGPLRWDYCSGKNLHRTPKNRFFMSEGPFRASALCVRIVSADQIKGFPSNPPEMYSFAKGDIPFLCDECVSGLLKILAGWKLR